MHESSLARQILTAVLARADAAGASRIRTVRGSLADGEALSADSLAWHFAAHARGTRAEGARLELRLLQVTARCRGCGARYAPPAHHLPLCPACGSTDGELLGEPGLRIDAMETDDS
jgi:hydrogenase nickel incorporation protein HypA/HybF